jgi:hypothetical protein
MASETYSTERVYDSTDPKPARSLTKVVAARGMNADTFWLHIKTRHDELRVNTSKPDIPSLRVEHARCHELLPLILGHYHEGEIGPEAAEKLVREFGLDARQDAGLYSGRAVPAE